MLTQKEMLDYFLPKLDTEGKRYKKNSLIKAKKAKAGLEVVTKTSDGVETKNIASEGDWLVENQTSAHEKYLIQPEVFDKKYDLLHSLEDGWGCYRPKGEVSALKVSSSDIKNLGAENKLEFEAPWKESIVVKPGDYLVISLENSEIYRVALKEFTQTYEPVKE
jgi:hypothetical protein